MSRNTRLDILRRGLAPLKAAGRVTVARLSSGAVEVAVPGGPVATIDPETGTWAAGGLSGKTFVGLVHALGLDFAAALAPWIDGPEAPPEPARVAGPDPDDAPRLAL